MVWSYLQWRWSGSTTVSPQKQIEWKPSKLVRKSPTASNPGFLLTGSIPDSLGNLQQLEGLILDGNQLNGSIPYSLGNLQQLEQLYLYDNQLSGSIPDSLGNLQQLLDLTLYNNQLSGSIPDSLGNLKLLQLLILNDNQLSGSIPDSLGKLKQLQPNNCNMANNNFACPVPDWAENKCQATCKQV